MTTRELKEALKLTGGDYSPLREIIRNIWRDKENGIEKKEEVYLMCISLLIRG